MWSGAMTRYEVAQVDNQRPVHEGPGGVAMQHHHRSATPFIDIMLAQPVRGRGNDSRMERDGETAPRRTDIPVFRGFQIPAHFKSDELISIEGS